MIFKDNWNFKKETFYITYMHDFNAIQMVDDC